MSDIRIEAGADQAIARLHGQAAAHVEESGGSAPGSVDAGPAGEAITAIMARVAGEAADLASVHRGAESVMHDVATDYSVTDASVTGDFEALGSGVPTGWVS